ncbi:hypothetical protein Esti_004090 [Eimeria stiedai]
MPRHQRACLLPWEADLRLASKLKPQETAKLRQLFKAFDEDGDGKVSAQDVGRAMRKEGIIVPTKQLQQCIWEADSDGDGYLDILDVLSLYARGKALGLFREAQLLHHFILYRLMVSREGPHGSLCLDDALHYLSQVLGKEAALQNLENLFGEDHQAKVTTSLWGESSPIVNAEAERRHLRRQLERPFSNNYKPKASVDSRVDVKQLVSSTQLNGRQQPAAAYAATRGAIGSLRKQAAATDCRLQ